MSDEQVKKIELLPGGKFFITVNDKKVKGRFSMLMLDRFCVSKNIDNYLTLFDLLTKGLRPIEYAEFVLMAIQDYFRDNEDQCEWTEIKVADTIIDEALDGLSSPEFDQLMRHAIGRIVNIKPFVEAANKLTAEEESEKKKELKSNSTVNSSNSDASSQA